MTSWSPNLHTLSPQQVTDPWLWANKWPPFFLEENASDSISPRSKIQDTIALSQNGNTEVHVSCPPAQLVKVRQGRQNARSGSFHVVVVMFPNVQHSKQQVDADSETSVHTNTQLNI